MIEKIAKAFGDVFLGLFQSPRDAYLSQATDLPDLERRMKQWERREAQVSNYTSFIK